MGEHPERLCCLFTKLHDTAEERQVVTKRLHHGHGALGDDDGKVGCDVGSCESLERWRTHTGTGLQQGHGVGDAQVAGDTLLDQCQEARQRCSAGESTEASQVQGRALQALKDAIRVSEMVE